MVQQLPARYQRPSTYSPFVAMDAQLRYCQENGLPVLVPGDGKCRACRENIFEAVTRGRRPPSGASPGILLRDAESMHIDHCPHCGAAF